MNEERILRLNWNQCFCNFTGEGLMPSPVLCRGFEPPTILSLKGRTPILLTIGIGVNQSSPALCSLLRFDYE